MSEIFRRLLPGWTLTEAKELDSVGGSSWSDGTGIAISRGPLGAYGVSFAGVADFVVNVPAKEVRYRTNVTRNDSYIEHLLLDQVVPRIIAHTEGLTIHGAGIVVGGQLLVIVGKSGRGKSTLASWFVSEGYSIIGDDAVAISITGHPAGRGLATKLRLLEDTAQHLGPRLPGVRGISGYAGKSQYDLSQSNIPELAIAAIFRLSEPQDNVRIISMSSSAACMALVGESFALDPLDCDQAGKRLTAASVVAQSVPCFDLTYPRRYPELGKVSRAILDSI